MKNITVGELANLFLENYQVFNIWDINQGCTIWCDTIGKLPVELRNLIVCSLDCLDGNDEELVVNVDTTDI